MSNEKKLPDWKDAPEWANWRAVDDDGELCYYYHKPVMSCGGWDISGLGEPFKEVGKFNITNWQDSLERRPEPQKLNDWESADMENDPNMDYTIAATFSPAQDKEPVTWEWLESLGFERIFEELDCKYHTFIKGTEILIIPSGFIVKNKSILIFQGRNCVEATKPGGEELTREKVLQIISVFS